MERDPGKIVPWLGQSFRCECGLDHEVPIEKVVIERGALERLPSYVKEKEISHVTLVADRHTYEAAGKRLVERLKSLGNGISVSLCVLIEDSHGDVAADEKAIVQLLVAAPEASQAFLAVGAGTIHDIVRFVSAKTGRPFISVPTAPSVDGFASVGAPLILRGFKQTIPACAPIAVFADLDVLAAAPKAMVAAGFGDMLGKYTSLADWELGRLVQNEHYCELCAEMTRRGLQLCIDHLEEIAASTPLGMEKLMEGLILSGISMLLLGSSRPASGAEHHLSHYWEMRFLQENRKALLHGAKVGVAAVKMAALYERLRELPQPEAEARLQRSAPSSREADEDAIRQAYGALADQVIRENFPAAAADAAANDKAAIAERWPQIQAAAAAVPAPGQLAAWLRAVGGPAAPEELPVEPALVAESERYAHFVRNRYTVLRLFRHLT